MLDHHHLDPKVPDRVVVIGARGFIGAALTRRLKAEGIPVLALTSKDVDLATQDGGDKLAAMLDAADSLVMLAALTPDKGRDMGAFMRNISMGAAVCAALERTPVTHVVYVSSDAVYPMNVATVNEESCAAPVDLYGTMHKAREVMLRSSFNGPYAVLRPTLVFGAADTHNSYGPNRLRRMARSDGKITLFGAGEETRDHILIDDVTVLMELVLRHRSSGVLNLATGQSINFDSLARKVATLFDPPAAVVHTERNNPVTHRHFDIANLHKAFPTFRFTPLEDGLAKAHREMLEQG